MFLYSFIFVEKISQLLNLNMIRLHDVATVENWQKQVYTSQEISHQPISWMDCATSCLYPEANLCEFFIFEPENLCHMGNLTELEGSMTTSAETVDVFLSTGKINCERVLLQFVAPHC